MSALTATNTRYRSSTSNPPLSSKSLITAATIGIFVGSVGVALNAVWFYRQTSWHVTATVQGLVQMLIITVLVTIVLEQRRKLTERLAQHWWAQVLSGMGFPE